jgi:hypothetical protein
VAKNGSFAFAEAWALCVGAKANVPFVPLAKIELKKSAVEKNKKYRRVGKECRLTRCPFMIWSVCWSLVKMVYFFLLIIGLSMVVMSSFTLAPNVIYTQ